MTQWRGADLERRPFSREEFAHVFDNIFADGSVVKVCQEIIADPAELPVFVAMAREILAHYQARGLTP